MNRAIGPTLRHTATALTGWLLLAVLIGACPGLFLWQAAHLGNGDFLLDNQLPPEQRRALFAWVGGSTAIVLAGYLAYGLTRRSRPGWSMSAIFRDINRYTLVLLALPLFNLLRIDRVETRYPFWTLLGCLAIAALAGSFAYAASQTKLLTTIFGRWMGFRPGLILAIGLGSSYAYVLSRFSLLHHHHLASSTYDLGIYTNIFWHTIHGDLLGCSFLRGESHLGAHFDPILILLSPLFLLYPHAETLLVFQSAWLGSGAIPLYLLGWRRTASAWFALVLVGVYLLYPALHGPNMYDFHSLTLAVPLLFWCVYSLEIRRFGGFWAGFVLLLITREDMALLGCALGLYAIVARRAPLVGASAIVISIAYLVATKLAVMSNSYSYIYYFSDLRPEGKKGVLGLAWTVVTNPIYVLLKAVVEKKLIFLLKLLVPLLFLPMVAGKMWILFAYGFAFVLLATRWAVYDTGFQYGCLLFPFLLCATPRAILRVTRSRLTERIGLDRSRLFAALCSALCIASLLVSIHYGVFWENSAFRGGFDAFARETTPERKERYQYVTELRERIGPHASVIASAKLGPHFAARKDFYRDPRLIETDYVLVWDRDLNNSQTEAIRFRDMGHSRTYRFIQRKYGIAFYERKSLKKVLP
jgi:uncharacterized membrane protein